MYWPHVQHEFPAWPCLYGCTAVGEGGLRRHALTTAHSQSEKINYIVSVGAYARHYAQGSPALSAPHARPCLTRRTTTSYPRPVSQSVCLRPCSLCNKALFGHGSTHHAMRCVAPVPRIRCLHAVHIGRTTSCLACTCRTYCTMTALATPRIIRPQPATNCQNAASGLPSTDRGRHCMNTNPECPPAAHGTTSEHTSITGLVAQNQSKATASKSNSNTAYRTQVHTTAKVHTCAPNPISSTPLSPMPNKHLTTTCNKACTHPALYQHLLLQPKHTGTTRFTGCSAGG